MLDIYRDESMVRADKMMKRLLIITLILALFGTPIIALASDISGAKYWAVIQISNNSTATANVATTCNINTQNLIDGNYLNASANNCVIRTSSGADIPFVPSVNATYPWCIWVPSIGENSYLNDILYTANSTGGLIRYFPGTGGMTTPDNDVTLELGDNFTIEQKGWVDTDNGPEKNLVYKMSAFAVSVSENVSANITAGIYSSTNFVLPTSDVGNAWTDPEKAYNDDTADGATWTNLAAGGWTDWIELHRKTTHTISTKYYAVSTGTGTFGAMEIEAYYGGAWTNIFTGAPVSGAWTTKAVTQLNVTGIRYKFQNTHGSNLITVSLREVNYGIDLYSPTVTATGVSSGEHTIKMVATVTDGWWNNDWVYKRKLTFDNSGCSENLTNIPVAISLDDTNFDFNLAQDDGDDIRFVDSDNSTALNYFAETWESDNETAIFRVKVPQIDANSITDHIYIYYGNDAASNGEDMEGVFESDIKLASTHKDSTATLLTDATSNNNDGTFKASGEPAWSRESSGLWVLDFDGEDDYVYKTASLPIASPLDAFTIEAWIRNDIGLPYPIFTEGRAAQNYAFFSFYCSDTRIGLAARNDANALLDAYSSHGLDADPPYTFPFDSLLEGAIDVNPESGGNHAEGVASDGTYLYATDRFNIWQLTKGGVKTGVENTSANTDGTDCDQINHIWVQGDYLYVGAANKNGVGSYIKIFNRSDLTYVEEHQVADHPGADGERWGTEGCCFYEGYWWVSYYLWKGIAKYDTDWNYVADYMTDSYSQGLFVIGGYLVVIQSPEAGIPQAWFYRWEDPNLVYHGKTPIPNTIAVNGGGKEPGEKVIWWADNPASNADGNIVKTTITGVWHKVGVTCDGAGTYKFYIDAVEYSEDVDTMTGNFTTLEHFALGALWRVAVANFFCGGIALPGIHNRALSAEEIENLYLQEKGLFGVSNGFVTFGDAVRLGMLELYVDGNLEDSVVGASIPNTSANWTFIENNVMPYMEYHKIWIDGNLRQHITWEYDTIFTDLSENDNDATPTFRTVSSDADVSAELVSFQPIAEAKAPDYVLGEAPAFIDEGITGNVTGTFTTTPGAGTFPLAGVITAIAKATDTPPQLPLLIIAVFIILAASLSVSAVMRRYGNGSLIVKILVIVAVMGVFIALKNFGIDFWMLVVFAIIGIALAMASRQIGWN